MLESVDLFKDLTNLELQQLAEIATLDTFNRGEFIFRQGDFSRDFYIIKNGQIDISLKDIFQQSKSLATLRNGEFFGEMALFDKNSARSANAVAVQKSQLIRIPAIEFERLLREKPNISFKLLGALSKRLKEANLEPDSPGTPSPVERLGKVIGVIAPRNGYGKTTLSTTMAQMMGAELPRRVLYIDLDLYYGDGTFLMGVFSPKSIKILAEGLRSGKETEEDLFKQLIKHHDNLYTLAAPQEFLDGEKITEGDLSRIIKLSRKYFDYVVIDTDSAINDPLLNVIDLADILLMVTEVGNPISVKSMSRFIQALAQMKIPDSRVLTIVSGVDSDFKPERAQHLLRYRLVGGIPKVENPDTTRTKTFYQAAPTGEYCEVVRNILHKIFPNEKLGVTSSSSFIYRLFFQDGSKAGNMKAEPGKIKGPMDPLCISDENVASIVKSIRNAMADGFLETAHENALKLVDLCPNSPDIYFILGELYHSRKDYSKAIEAFRRTLELDQDHSRASGRLGILVNDETMLNKAIERLEKDRKEHPDFPDLLNDLGQIYLLNRDFETAITHLRRALEVNPHYADARINLAIAYGENQQYDEAIQSLMLIEPKRARIFYLLGSYYYQLGLFFYSMRAYARAAAENPRFFDVEERVHELRTYFNKLDSLLEMHQRLARKNPTYPDLQFKVGNIAMLLGRFEEAKKAFEGALRLKPDYPGVQDKMAEIERLTRLHFLEEPEIGLIQEQGSSREDPFSMEIKLGNIPPHLPTDQAGTPNFRLHVQNNRTGSFLNQPLDIENLTKGTVSIACGTLGRILQDDLLLLRLEDSTSGTPIAVMPHRVSIQNLMDRRATVDLAAESQPQWYYAFAVEETQRVPVQYFQVSVFCQELADELRNPDSGMIAEMENRECGASALGHPSEENAEIVDFLFISPNRKDVVNAGSNLNLTVKRDEQVIFKLGIPVLTEDVEGFRKAITLKSFHGLFSERALDAATPPS